MADIDKKETGSAADGAASESGYSRRQFLTGVGGMGIGAVLGGALLKSIILPEEVLAVPASGGYILVDTKKCSGCTTCMLTCSLTHYGETSLSLARIQVIQDSFGKFPDDIEIDQCRQCPYPSCVDACPTGANHIDAENGNVRMIDYDKCIGCERCVNACPFTPSRVQWNPEEKHAQKCDLCADTPYWSEEGGPDGKHACVEACPMRAITFTRDIPAQTDAGYDVDLRAGTPWDAYGFPGAAGGTGVPGSH